MKIIYEAELEQVRDRGVVRGFEDSIPFILETTFGHFRLRFLKIL